MPCIVRQCLHVGDMGAVEQRVCCYLFVIVGDGGWGEV